MTSWVIGGQIAPRSNYRLSEWQGAILQVQLSRLDAQTKRRHQNSRLLDRLLREIPGITPQKLDERCTRNGQYAYIFHVNKKEFAGMSTERFIEAMNAEIAAALCKIQQNSKQLA